MKPIRKVVWKEGMFLTPQLFQQADHYHESLLHFRLRALSRFDWGLTDLEIDREGLSNGQVTLLRCRGIFPDGLPFQIPDVDDAAESRSIKPHCSPTTDRLDVMLTIAAARPGTSSFHSLGTIGGHPTRYEIELVQIADETGEGGESEVPLARKNFRIIFSGESLAGTVWMKVAEVRRTPAGTFELDDAYIPPSLRLGVSTKLMAILRNLFELVSAKSSTLSQQRRHVAEFGISDTANFWLLHTVNSSIPTLAHFFHAPDRHPEELYLALVRLAGELSTFALETDPRELPPYDHEDLGLTFGELEQKIRLLLETVIPTKYVLIPLEPARDFLHTGRIHDERLIKTAQFYLGTSAQVPTLRLTEEIPAKAKISSPDEINDLIGRAVRGVELSYEAVPPSAIPVKTGFKYFHLNPRGRFWEGISRTKAVAIYLPDEFPEIRLELVAVRD